MSHIFISYSRKDTDCAYKIQRQLEAQGFNIWIDKNDIPAGAPFPLTIIKAISEASVVLILWSQHAEQSHFVDKEIEEALNQKMMRSIPVIPVWLDNTPLRSEFKTLNAITMTGCTDKEIDTLINKIPEDIRQSIGRQFLELDLDKPLIQQPDQMPVPGTGLVSVPFVKSWFCSANIVAHGNTIISNHIANSNNKPYICVVSQFLGDTQDSTIEQVYNSIQSKLDGQDFVAIHIKPNTLGKITIDINERGQTLDAVKTTYDAVYNFVRQNRSLATIKIFTPMMAAMSGSALYMFDSFWHIQAYHFDRQSNQYCLLFDSKDL
jgi:hypothetical protein